MQIPGYVVETFVFITIAYWLMGLRPNADAFFYTFFICVLTCNTAAACGIYLRQFSRQGTILSCCLLSRNFLFGRLRVDSISNQFPHPIWLHLVYNWRCSDQLKVQLKILNKLIHAYLTHTFRLGHCQILFHGQNICPGLCTQMKLFHWFNGQM